MPTPTVVPTVDPSGSSAWEIVTGVGTLLAVVAALGIALTPVIWRRLRKPKLVVEVGEREPHVRLAHRLGGSEGPNAFYLRMTVRNNGKTEARRVRVTLMDWYVLEPVEGFPDWARLDTDPAALHWVSMTHAREKRDRVRGGYLTSLEQPVPEAELIDRHTPPEVNLPAGLVDLVDLAVFSNNKLALILDDNRPRGFKQVAPFPDREFKLTLAITAENAVALTRTVCFRVDLDNGFQDVRFCEPPAQARDAGLLTMLKAVAEEQAQALAERKALAEREATVEDDQETPPTSD